MAVLFPSDIVPSSVNDLVPIYPSKDYTSELTQTSQHSISETCLYELEYTFPALTLSQYRKVKTILHQAHHSGLIIPYYEPLIKYNPYGESITLASDILSPSYSIQVAVNNNLYLSTGMAISIKSNNIYYVYVLAADSIPTGGVRTLTLTNKTRKPHYLGDSIYYNPAYIQGWPTITWPQDTTNNGWYQGLKVKIREDK